jgi:hypothetical protein
MRIYFYDINYRAIGNRELNEGEVIPPNATTTPVSIGDGQEAYFTNGQWQTNELEAEPVPIPIPVPSLEDRVTAVEDVLMDILI